MNAWKRSESVSAHLPSGWRATSAVRRICPSWPQRTGRGECPDLCRHRSGTVSDTSYTHIYWSRMLKNRRKVLNSRVRN